MKIRLSLGEIEFNDDRLLGEWNPNWPETTEEEETLVREAMDYPIGNSLREMSREGARALILVEDQTRPTPLAPILPVIIEELQWGGIEPEDTRIVIASGAHRPMTNLEKIQKLGNFATTYEVYDHHPREALSYLGESPNGIPLTFDSLLFEADLIIGVGRIAPHRVTGYSGGSALLLGMAGYQTIGAYHWLSAQYSGLEIFGQPDNPIRQELNSLAQLLKFNYMVNVILDDNHQIAGATAGDPVQGFQEGCRIAQEIFQTSLLEQADIVICQAPSDPGQLPGRIASLFSAERAVKEGGAIVLLDPYLRLDGDAHYSTPQEAMKWHSENPENPFWATHLAHVSWVTQRAKVIIVSPFVSAELAEKVGFYYAPDPQEGLALATQMTGEDSRIAILRYSGEVVPVLAP